MTEYLIAHIGHTQKHDEHVCWWKPESKGYTICIDKAGAAVEKVEIMQKEGPASQQYFMEKKWTTNNDK